MRGLIFLKKQTFRLGKRCKRAERTRKYTLFYVDKGTLIMYIFNER